MSNDKKYSTLNEYHKEGTMLKKLMNRIYRNQKGITGLETAIILIAFVVVAAVFAYTVLSAGLFSTQKSQEAVYSGLESTQSTLELKGAVIAKAETSGANASVGQLTFTVTPVVGGESLDFTPPTGTGDDDGLADSGSENSIVITYIDQNQKVEDLFWTADKLGNADLDDLLENGEKFQITIGGNVSATTDGGNLEDALTTALSSNDSFTIEIKTSRGAVLSFARTMPPYIDNIMSLN
jgi:archaeal flagellin FlaB